MKPAGLAAAIILWALAGGTATAEPVNRLNKEAKALFAFVLNDTPPLQPCEFGTEWDTYSIPEDIARSQFGLTAHADLSAPDNAGKFEDIIDPKHQHASSFCDPATTKAGDNTRLKAFETSAEPSFHIYATTLTFPVFDAHFRKAVVIMGSTSINRARLKGQVLKLEPELSLVAFIYAKRHGVWRIVSSETLLIS